MIILDTNVVLEPTRTEPNPAVLDWLNRQAEDELWVTAITAAELQTGVERLTAGVERERWQALVSAILDDDFLGKVLPFDLDAALIYAAIAGPKLRAERQIRTMDFQIAAIARGHGAALATRNVKDFASCGVDLIDPWTA